MSLPVVLRGALPAGLLAAAVLVTGCSSGARAPYRATASTCFAFAVTALQQHVTVTTVPQACAGLSHEQVNLAVTRAVREVVGPQSKVTGRRLTHQEIAYLVHLIQTAPVSTPAPLAAPPAGRSPGLPLRLAALAAWVVTVLAGAWLLAGWLAHGGLRRRGPQTGGVPRVVIVGHFTLALTGLGIWIAFVATGVPALAWAAVGVILSVAGLGMATLAGGLPETEPSVGPAAPGADEAAGPGPDEAAGPGPDEAAGPGPAVARTAVQEAPAAARKPLALIAAHGALAATTILLVVLAAAGVA